MADSFQGLPAPSKDYPQDKISRLHKHRILIASKEEVKQNFDKFDLLDENVKFLEGWFHESLPAAPIESLSLLRLDGDLYESTSIALKNLYPKLEPGGFVIIDDYNAFSFCKKAVDDYRRENEIKEEII